MSWYEGPTVLEQFDLFEKEKDLDDHPFRMPVQDVYKFTRFNDKRRIIAGNIETGTLQVGDDIVFYPSGKHSKVKSIEAFNRNGITRVTSSYATGFTLEEQIYVQRGEIAAKLSEIKPKVSSRLKVNLFWLGKKPLSTKKSYIFKLGTARVPMHVEEVVRVIDASNLSASAMKESVGQHEVAECVLKLAKSICFDTVEDIPKTSRFVIVDEYEIRGGGIIRSALEEKTTTVRQNVVARNYNWQTSHITPEKRAERYNQRAAVLLVTGKEGARKQNLAKYLEEQLFHEGKLVYFLGIGNLLSGVNADIKEKLGKHKEHIRRLAELTHIFLDSGMILVVAADELTQDDLQLIKLSVSPDRIETVWVGDEITTDINFDLHVPSDEDTVESVERIKEMLKENRIIFSPY
jgi:bifunctional enzyme CysN/CysC